MAYGRREVPLGGRVAAQVPDLIVVLRRGVRDQPEVRRCDAAAATRWLVAGTYMAGELRRFWSFAATLSAGTGVQAIPILPSRMWPRRLQHGCLPSSSSWANNQARRCRSSCRWWRRSHGYEPDRDERR